ncbi:MAG: hypothetical protein INQ03_02855 [Candidatus Heimdallarchaeota archaeon]|nr:hypothetical protein [Candidatus Heimdallarchaeota archaeon]
MKKIVVIGLFFLILGIAPNTVRANPHGISSITYSPEVVYTDTNVTISIDFGDASNVTKVRSFYCKIQPDYNCHVPPLLLVQDGNTFSSSFIVVENNDETIGFDLVIYYEDSTVLTLPKDNPELTFGMKIAEPIDEMYYYQIDLGDTSDETTEETNSTEDVTSGSITKDSLAYFPLMIFIPLSKIRKRY